VSLLWLSAIDVRVRLQGLRRDPYTSLQEHAITVEKLAQIRYGNLPPVNQERYTFDAFIQSLIDLSLYYQLLATGVVMDEDALREGRANLLDTQLCRGRASSR